MADPLIATVRPPVRVELSNGALTTSREKSSVSNLLLSDVAGLANPPRWFGATSLPVARAMRAGFSTTPRFHPVPVDHSILELAYNDFATRVLWFCHHDLLGDYPISKPHILPQQDAYRAFEHVNCAFADELASHVDHDTPVVVNDYQLSLVPRLLRQLSPDTPITHISYTAFAEVDTWRRLPSHVRLAVVKGMLGSNLLGFTATRWATNFVSCALMTVNASYCQENGRLDHAAGTTHIRVYPLHINPPRIAALQLAGEKSSPFHNARSRFLVTRTDRLDPAKNVLRGFESYERLLRNSQDPGALHFAACLVPTRQALWEYREYAERVMETVDRINRRYPEAVQLYLGDDHPRALSLLTGSDLFLANSIADGMNLSAQEAVAVGRNAGMLLLSHNMGTTDLFHQHAHILPRPRSIEDTATRIARCLDIPRDDRAVGATSMKSLVAASRRTLLARVLSDLDVTSAAV